MVPEIEEMRFINFTISTFFLHCLQWNDVTPREIRSPKDLRVQTIASSNPVVPA